MLEWQHNTCVRFRFREPQDRFFVQYKSDKNACFSSHAGRQRNTSTDQLVNIGKDCANLNSIVHELGHLIGLYHEHSRPDRDKYIRVLYENLSLNSSDQFRKERDLNHGVPYDYTSVMHYDQWGFGNKVFEKNTIVTLDPSYQRFITIAHQKPLSFRDIKSINIMYSCSVNCINSNTTKCLNGGYLKPITIGQQTNNVMKQCICACPPNTQGSQCEIMLRSDYYEPLPCGGVITTETLIQTPHFPQRLAPYKSCMWDIKAPSFNQTVSIKFEAFSFGPRFTGSIQGYTVVNKCVIETIEIRLNNSNIYDGDIYCEKDIAPNTVLKSNGPRAVIIITADDKMIGEGLRAKVEFEFVHSNVDKLNDDQSITTIDPNLSTVPLPLTTISPEITPQTDEPTTIIALFAPVNNSTL